LLQLALIVVGWPTARGDGGLAVGAQTGTPLPPTHVTVWLDGVPETTKLVQPAPVYVTVAAVAAGGSTDIATNTEINAA
jgi:hypothetical protein